MSAIRAIFKRDLAAYFKTPVGWAILALVSAISGLIFGLSVLGFFSNMAGLLQVLQNLLFILIPLLTMRAFAEERKNGTDRLLFTLPIRSSELVLGKFAAAFVFFLCLTATTFLELFLTRLLGGVLDSAVWVAYLSFITLGFSYTCISLFIAVLTENQIMAAMLSMVTLLALQAVQSVASLVGNFVNTLIHQLDIFNWILPAEEIAIGQATIDALLWLSPAARINSLSLGYLSLSALFYVITFSLLWLVFAILALDRRRWASK